jgi:hypothetical protein
VFSSHSSGNSTTVQSGSHSSLSFLVPQGLGSNNEAVFSIRTAASATTGAGWMSSQWSPSVTPFVYNAPTVTRVSGCPVDSGSATADCPLIGSTTITIEGTNFGYLQQFVTVTITVRLYLFLSFIYSLFRFSSYLSHSVSSFSELRCSLRLHCRFCSFTQSPDRCHSANRRWRFRFVGDRFCRLAIRLGQLDLLLWSVFFCFCFSLLPCRDFFLLLFVSLQPRRSLLRRFA